MRIGTGWDVHRLAEGRKFILGGIVIPSERGEVAHSDGDVLVHAIIDAILGALAKGDIGAHFPDTDPAFKDADSLQLLSRVLEEDLPPYSIENIDTTVIVQRPKLREYIDAIRENLANTMHLEISQVSVKAKTAEGILGELGTAEAVMAQAVVLISQNPC
ncbi:2-C-methyl-D-erythritol 2,4-cyclodiphosphate synthase [Sphaerochaeta sp. S2]|uniref:2-C-methyl-D-erythritol 2,4-cyclodiphosphate synthase n=1 Tax=Sphaerochaeta sp. S2 TaxID=2798868 RepID=UPI0018E96EE9|nr:2-C-methyl-D-erythritol 2,4-cyclodiphosphate synthase [Sphaerochaeta sp. S2]MBJ2355742.1 2-C-methyl-D-erythritol 2,4-cyclodiphosphate synthase [Sphaerochaeta sp. S2]